MSRFKSREREREHRENSKREHKERTRRENTKREHEEREHAERTQKEKDKETSKRVPKGNICGTFSMSKRPHSRTKRYILTNTLAKHIVFDRKSEPKLKKGPLQKKNKK